ncbi:hypothetical protein Y032_0043g745 [Ancylostoma ceylanicum]|uniref:Uncharacterized protein n=1 Tax=Ancylostoma ceylanicum TaxID=53326 RepID=A0A016UF62_9BILA|nr:hypothetical protein Y032_0043g745 [Ancylostoma ceylanicum]
MHYNALRLAEITGERREERVLEVQKKYLQRKSLLVFKTPIEHVWREEIIQKVLMTRLQFWEQSIDGDDGDEAAEQANDAAGVEEDEVELHSDTYHVLTGESDLEYTSDEEDVNFE